jgi:hypothetical protein
MATVSGISASSTYGGNAPVTGAGVSVSQKPNAQNSNAVTAQSASSLSALESVFASSGSGLSLPLTYNAAGLLNSSGQATALTPAKTSAQAAQNAVLAAQNVVTQTLGSLFAGSSPNADDSSNSSGSAVSSLLGLPGTLGTSGSNDPFGSLQNPLLNTPSSASAKSGSAAKTVQDAVLAAENAVTNTLDSLTSGSSAHSSRARAVAGQS